jgi:hypothetical protein
MSDYLTIAQLAEERCVHPNTIKNRIKDGLLPYSRTKPKTGRILIKREWADKLFKKTGGQAYGQ